jgi:DNA primase
MVTSGFEATVAPLGTALTADQLVLLWKMADEPTLCFDGDSAGRRAAYRAVDLALPLIKAGKSLKFASLPEGHDPDDLVRAGGREAITEVIGAARPLAHVLWMRETEGGGFDAPERRAAFEAGSPRLRRPSATIPCANIIVRSSATGCGRCSRPTCGRRCGRGRAEWRTTIGGRTRGAKTNRNSSRCSRSGIRDAFRCRRALRGGERATGLEPVHRGHRAAIPLREALILQAVINHPGSCTITWRSSPASSFGMPRRPG